MVCLSHRHGKPSVHGVARGGVKGLPRVGRSWHLTIWQNSSLAVNYWWLAWSVVFSLLANKGYNGLLIISLKFFLLSKNCPYIFFFLYTKRYNMLSNQKLSHRARIFCNAFTKSSSRPAFWKAALWLSRTEGLLSSPSHLFSRSQQQRQKNNGNIEYTHRGATCGKCAGMCIAFWGQMRVFFKLGIYQISKIFA